MAKKAMPAQAALPAQQAKEARLVCADYRVLPVLPALLARKAPRA